MRIILFTVLVNTACGFYQQEKTSYRSQGKSIEDPFVEPESGDSTAKREIEPVEPFDPKSEPGVVPLEEAVMGWDAPKQAPHQGLMGPLPKPIGPASGQMPWQQPALNIRNMEGG